LTGFANGAVYCIDSSLATELPRLPGPTIVIVSGARVSDEVVVKVRAWRITPLRLSDITPKTLLRALVSATAGSDIDDVAARLQRIGRFAHVDRAVIAAFLENPARMRRLTDLRRSLAPLSRESAQGLVRSCGFRRAEHLFTALRCAVWALLVDVGVGRQQAEPYLGIHDRGSLRRACQRAGVPAPCPSQRVGVFEN
jgi:hypothetical protein